jgi:NDP-sugar pyrophosphorylase family protein
MLLAVPPPIAVMVLAAGLGSRLAPLSSLCPKALVPVGDRPALAHVLARVAPIARSLVINTHHRADALEAFARGWREGALALVVSRETELLGTAGGIRAADGALGRGDVLVWNSDMIGPLDAASLVEAHMGAASLATLAVRLCAGGARGNVGLDDEGRVVRLRGETGAHLAGRETRGAEFVGVHVLGEELRRVAPPTGCLVSDVYLPMLRRGARIGSHAIDVEMIDIGTLPEYLRANLRWLSERGARVWHGEAARVADGVTLDGVVLGVGGRVTGNGRVESCVVWPGGEAVAPIARAVATPDGVIRVGV